jgi:hypothetical protein
MEWVFWATLFEQKEKERKGKRVVKRGWTGGPEGKLVKWSLWHLNGIGADNE